MKVTALIPDKLVEDVKSLSHAKNITEALVVALSEWRASKHLQAANRSVLSQPLSFKSGYTAEAVRRLNRKRT